MNKVIQITSCGHDRNEHTQSNQTLFALDSDGNIYKMSNEDHEWDTIKSPITTSNSEYKTATPQLNQLRKLLLEQKQLDPEINKLVNENFWDLV